MATEIITKAPKGNICDISTMGSALVEILGATLLMFAPAHDVQATPTIANDRIRSETSTNNSHTTER